MVTIKCVACGVEFQAKNYRTKYCSKACHDHNKYIRRRDGLTNHKNLPPDRVCIQCGKPLPPDRIKSNAITCSLECSKLNKVENRKREYQLNKAKKLGVTLEYYLDEMQGMSAQAKENKEAKTAEREIIEKQKARRKREKDSIAYRDKGLKEDAEAKKLGLSHGEYQALKYTGQLEKYKKNLKKQPKISNVYRSQIGS